MPRKRFSAFEDFPVEEPSAAPGEPQPAATLYKKQIAEGHVLPAPEAPQVERIERLPPSQMMPDRFQPRRLLPTALRQAFYSGQMDCYLAARQWLQMAKNDKGIKKEVDRLMAMGDSFGEHGQIKPITGSWAATSGGGYVFLIETGERRFWAACLQHVAHQAKEEPLLRVEVITAPTRMRQVLENRHAEPPSSVGQACEVAALILAELNIPPQDNTADEFDYFRQARAKRMPPGLWEKIMPIMQLTRERMVQLLNILDLPTQLLDLADRYRVPERVLREVLRAPTGQWEQLLVSSVQNSLTSDDIAELAENPRPQPKSEKRVSSPPDPATQAINAVKRFSAAMEMLDETTQAAVLDELANEMVVNGRGEHLVDLVSELARLIQIRQQSKYRRR
jgi:hypothetical protein